MDLALDDVTWDDLCTDAQADDVAKICDSIWTELVNRESIIVNQQEVIVSQQSTIETQQATIETLTKTVHEVQDALRLLQRQLQLTQLLKPDTLLADLEEWHLNFTNTQ
jgi:hypothetical protein